MGVRTRAKSSAAVRRTRSANRKAAEASDEATNGRGGIVTTGGDDLPGYSHEEVFARYREQVPVNKDFTAERNERLFPMPQFIKNVFASVMEKPETDMICVELMLNVTLVLVPVMLFNFFSPLLARRYMGEEEYATQYWKVYLLALVLHLSVVITFYLRFILTLHVCAHRRIFKRSWNFLNSYNELVGH